MSLFSGLIPLETKFQSFGHDLRLTDGAEISGYASLFEKPDNCGDVVQKGAYKASLAELAQSGRAAKMLWQHDATKPIGVWEKVHEDERGLFVCGRLLTEVQAGREALALLKAGAIDGLSIGYRTVRSDKPGGLGRRLFEVELWEVSLVTFPMLTEARVHAEFNEENDIARALVETFVKARSLLG